MARWILDREPESGSPSTNLRRLMDDATPGDAAGVEGRRLVAQAVGCGAIGAADAPVGFVSRWDGGDTADGSASLPVGRDAGGDPAATLTVVGIAGASGKSAAAAFLRGIARAEGQVVGSVGAATWFDGDSIRPHGTDGADASKVGAMLTGMRRQGCDSAILEVGRAAIDRRDLDGVALTVAVVTNLGDDDRASRRRSCARLIRRVEAGGTVVIDADDPEADVLGAGNLAARRVTFGIDADADADADANTAGEARGHSRANVSAVIERLDAGSCRFWLRGFDRDVVVTLRVGGGRATVRQALAAAAVAWSLGISADAVVRGLESVARVPGRFEPVRAGQPFEVRVDQARQAGDLTRALAHLRAIASGRIICVIGAEGASIGEPSSYLQEAERAALGRAAELGADLVVLTADNPRNEDLGVIIDEVRAGMIRPGRARIELDRRDAIAFALAEARPGDGVLIAGKGYRGGQALADRVVPFDDAAVANQLLGSA